VPKKTRLALLLDDHHADHVVEADDEAVVDLVCKSHQSQARTRAVVASFHVPTTTTLPAHVGSVFADDLFLTQPPPPLPVLFDDSSPDEPNPSHQQQVHTNTTATQLRQALIRQRLKASSPTGKHRAELVDKYGALAARARNFDRSLAEKLAALVVQYRQRQIDAVAQALAPPLRQSNSLDASERLARRIAQRDREFEGGASNDAPPPWLTSFSSPSPLATPTAPSVPPTGDWFTPNGPIGQQKASNAVKRLEFYD
jgi:hypothetical protein